MHLSDNDPEDVYCQTIMHVRTKCGTEGEGEHLTFAGCC
jgi:hypothetical protein